MNFSNKKFLLKSVFVSALFLFAASANISSAQTAGIPFLIDSSYDSAGRNSVTATERFAGQNAHFFVEDAYWTNLTVQSQSELLANISNLSNEFDNTIYPAMHQYYGTERNPGIDNDPKIYVLLANLVKDAGGYYNPNDEYYKNQVKEGKSNEKEIIYLNVNLAGKANIKPFLAHEFQHMINWNQKKLISNVDEEVWLNEALSEYVSAVLDYDSPFQQSITESRVKAFLQDPSDSLTEWRNTSQDYAEVNLFMRFLIDHYGKNIIKDIIASKKTGIEAINDALRKSGSEALFEDVFSDWVIANYLNDGSVKNGRYSYLNSNLGYDALHVAPTESFTLEDASVVKSIEYAKDWSGKWYRLNSSTSLKEPNRTLKIDFNSEDAASNFKVPYMIKNIDGAISFGSIELDSAQKGTAYVSNFGTAVTSVVLMPISEKKRALFGDSEPMTEFNYTASVVGTGIPVIKGLNPAVSVGAGGTLVTITGENFAADSIVKFGGVTVVPISVPDSKTIIVKAPPYPQGGSVAVEIISQNSLSAVAPQFFTYLPLASDGSLIRAEGDYRVYVIKGKYKRWIQSPKIFNMHNFRWDSIITVSPQTSDYYETSRLVRAEGDYRVYEIGANNIKRHLNMTGEQFSQSGRAWDSIFTISKAERNLYRTGAAITK